MPQDRRLPQLMHKDTFYPRLYVPGGVRGYMHLPHGALLFIKSHVVAVFSSKDLKVYAAAAHNSRENRQIMEFVGIMERAYGATIETVMAKPSEVITQMSLVLLRNGLL